MQYGVSANAFLPFRKKYDRKKTTKGGLCGSHKKDRASHEVRMAGIFCGWGFCPAELPVINEQVKPDHMEVITIYRHTLQKCASR